LKIIEDQYHDDEYLLEQVHKEEKEKTIDDDIFNKKGCQVLEEIIEEGRTNLLAQDYVETFHRVNSLCAMIAEKCSLNDEEYFHEMHHVENPVEFVQYFFSLHTKMKKWLVAVTQMDLWRNPWI
jgi:hypothetical protein